VFGRAGTEHLFVFFPLPLGEGARRVGEGFIIINSYKTLIRLSATFSQREKGRLSLHLKHRVLPEIYSTIQPFN
jgi:hypothetical protein